MSEIDLTKLRALIAARDAAEHDFETKETCLNGDVWFVAERWRNSDWSAPYTTRFETAAAAQAWLDFRFDDLKSQLIATRERVFP